MKETNPLLLDYQAHLLERGLAKSTCKGLRVVAASFLRTFPDLKVINADDVEAFKKKRHAYALLIGRFISYLQARNLINLDLNKNQNESEVTALTAKYVESLKLKHLAPSTMKQIRRVMKIFVSFLAERGIRNINEINRKVLMDFNRSLRLHEVKHRSNKTYVLSTISNILAQIKKFFAFLCREGIIIYDCSTVLVLPKKPRRVCRNVVGFEDMEKIIAQIPVNTVLGLRDLAIVETLYATAMRVGELIALKLTDINFEDGTILIRDGKEKTDRVVPIHRYGLRLLKFYIAEIRVLLMTRGRRQHRSHDVLFVNYDGLPFCNRTISMMIRDYAVRAGLEQRVSAHSIRATTATHLLKNGCDIRYIQVLLGHRKLDSTAHYTKIVISDLQDTIQKYHPCEVHEDESASTHQSVLASPAE